MESLVTKQYVIPDVDKRKLKKLGFKKNEKISNVDNEFYCLRFPLLQYLKSTTVEGEIIINLSDGSVRLNAYSYGTNSYYPPFYQTEYNEVYSIIMEDINQKFAEKFKEIGIKIL